jgi:hypothetical protein
VRIINITTGAVQFEGTFGYSNTSTTLAAIFPISVYASAKMPLALHDQVQVQMERIPGPLPGSAAADTIAVVRDFVFCVSLILITIRLGQCHLRLRFASVSMKRRTHLAWKLFVHDHGIPLCFWIVKRLLREKSFFFQNLRFENFLLFLLLCFPPLRVRFGFCCSCTCF